MDQSFRPDRPSRHERRESSGNRANGGLGHGVGDTRASSGRKRNRPPQLVKNCRGARENSRASATASIEGAEFWAVHHLDGGARGEALGSQDLVNGCRAQSDLLIL